MKTDTEFILCPWHVEKTPSCAINFDNEFVHCFGCGKAATIPEAAVQAAKARQERDYDVNIPDIVRARERKAYAEQQRLWNLRSAVIRANVDDSINSTERMFLGLVLLGQMPVSKLPQNWERDDHALIASAMREIAESGTQPDFVNVYEKLKASHKSEQYGGPAYISGLVDGL